MDVAVIGTGHVGVVTCVSLASMGHRVVGTDRDAEKIALLSDGRVPFHEPGVEDLLHDELDGGRLSFTVDPGEALAKAAVVLISVGTPPRAAGDANLVAVEAAAQTVARHATRRCAVVEKSTVPTGTASRLRRALERENGKATKLEVVSNPEFLREGHAVHDALHPDRILVGADSQWARKTMRRLYAPLVEGGAVLVETDIASAELAKHACNAFLALKISFSNALARLCERSGADVEVVTEVMGMDPRIAPGMLKAGIGFGGSCFPKDLMAFRRLASALGYDFPLLDEISRINDQAVDAVVDKVRDALWNLEGKTVALWGLAFKPGTDDVRFAPSLALARRLISEGARVIGYDPQAAANSKSEVPELEIAPDPYEAAAGAHCLVVCTQWEEFSGLDLERIRATMTYPIVVDGRNLFDPEQMRRAGFAYYPTGRPSITT
ncbi:MAG: UDP-glucose dehydrogenase family protein [Actinomycetota bacterium]